MFGVLVLDWNLLDRSIKLKKSLLLAFACVALPVASQAQLFDFEGVPPTAFAYVSPGVYSSVSQTVSGVTVSITRSSSAHLDITENSTFTDPGFSMPGSWGHQTLSPFSAESAGDKFVATFSVPVLFASIEFGDFGGDDDDTVVMEAWTGHGATGAMVDTSTVSWGLDDIDSDPPGTVSVFSSTAFSSVTFTGGSTSFDTSLYWDNLNVESVPEPATMTLLGLGALAALKRKKKA